MLFAIAVFGCFIAAMGLVGIVLPTALVRFLQSFWARPSGMYWAIGFRLVLGGLLIFAGPESRYPLTLQTLGVITVAAAVAVPLLGYLRLAQFVEWWARQPPWLVRTWGLVAVAFGAFLVYAAMDVPYAQDAPLPGP